MDVELLAAECNLYSNGHFIKKFLCCQNTLYITFKFAPTISDYDLDRCYYDFNSYTNYPTTEDYILIISVKPTFEDQVAINRTGKINSYLILGQSNFMCIIKNNAILKQGTDIKHMYYFFNTLCDYSLFKVNRTWFTSGNAILGELFKAYEELKKYQSYDSLIHLINSGEDYFNLKNYINKYPKHSRAEKLQKYISSEIR